jgi:hypothetical protein
MKIMLDKEYELKLSSLAVEKVEEAYDKAIDEIFTNGKMRAKDVNFILWASMEEAPELNETKKLFAKYYNYQQLIEILNCLLGADPNGNKAADIKQD